MNWELFWTAFGAIGTTLGAFATFAAVVVALWQSKNIVKKKVRIEFQEFKISEGDPIYALYISNLGMRDITIASWAIVISSNNGRTILDDDLPVTISPENSHAICITHSQLAGLIRDLVTTKKLNLNESLTFLLEDATGERFYHTTDRTIGELFTAVIV